MITNLISSPSELFKRSTTFCALRMIWINRKEKDRTRTKQKYCDWTQIITESRFLFFFFETIKGKLHFWFCGVWRKRWMWFLIFFRENVPTNELINRKRINWHRTIFRNKTVSTTSCFYLKWSHFDPNSF